MLIYSLLKENLNRVKMFIKSIFSMEKFLRMVKKFQRWIHKLKQINILNKYLVNKESFKFSKVIFRTI